MLITKPSTPVELEEDILSLLNDTARLMSTYADRIARRYGISKAQWVVLIRLGRNPGLSQRDLAQIMEVEPISVGRLVDRLEAHGLVKRLPDDQDRRIWHLHLLPAADPILAELAKSRSELAAMLLSGLDKTAIEAVGRGLAHIKSNVTSALGRQEPPGDLSSFSSKAVAKV